MREGQRSKEERFRNLLLGALLHDVGKVLHRAGEGKGAHAQRGADWLRSLGLPEEVASFAEFHHKRDIEEHKGRSADHLLVCEADNLSAGERPPKGEEEDAKERWEPFVPLLNPFSKLSLEHAEEEPRYPGAWSFFPLDGKPLSTDFLPYPVPPEEVDLSEGRGEAYRRIVEGLKGDIKRILLDEEKTPQPDALLHMLEKWLSFVPSETLLPPPREGRGVRLGKLEADPAGLPDISLFDHLKTTAAIASAMFAFLWEKGPEEFKEGTASWELVSDRKDRRYLLVSGDISGVQNFVYNISSRGALKGLRARSFWLELLTEHVASEILERAGMSRANLIFCGGGHFLLLLPNTETAREAVEAVGNEFNCWLRERHGLRLYLAVAFEEASGEDLMGGPGLSSIMERLGASIGRQKGGRFAQTLKSEDFEPQEPKRGRCRKGCPDVPFECQVCHVEGVEEFEHDQDPETGEVFHLCPFCWSLRNLGGRLPKVKFVARFPEGTRVKEGVAAFDLPGARLAAHHDLGELLDADKPHEAVYVVNSFSAEDFTTRGARPLLVANYIMPWEREEAPSFSELTSRARGAERLAALRADVDSLGRLVTHGLHKAERSFSRMASISRLLNLFFKLGVSGICQGKCLPPGWRQTRVGPETSSDRKRAVAIVYSGGDDLFVVGAYDEVAELAFDIRGAFRRFVGENPYVTLSGGIAVFGPKFPIHLMAEMAGEAEEEAKSYSRPDGKEKDALSLFHNLILVPPEGRRHEKLKVSPWFEERTFGWEEAEGLLRTVNHFASSFCEEAEERLSLRLPRRALFKVLEMGRFYEEEGKLYLPHAAWLVSRTSPPEGVPQEDWEAFRDWLLDFKNARFLRAFATWLILLTGGGEREWREQGPWT